MANRGLTQSFFLLTAGTLMCAGAVTGQSGAAKTIPSHAQLRPAAMDEASWTDGFWAERFERCRRSTLPAVEQGLKRPDNGEQLDALLIAAGMKEGERKKSGTNWTDGDCYKWIEAMARIHAATKDPGLEKKMDEWIAVIARAQSSDGYLSTTFWNNPGGRLRIPHFHELYNMGHLLTAACVHYRATGKTTFLDIAEKTAAFLYRRCSPRPPDLVHFPWNPSVYMGLIDLYRATGETRHRELAELFIENRGSSPGGGTHRNGGTDQTQDRVPLLAEKYAVGHAVCAMYLYCGAADLYAETGDERLLAALKRIWRDVTSKRMFITGGVGAGNGTSKRGDPVHEAFLDDYFLPNDCYCETCSNIGNAMWNMRLLNITGDAKFADLMEQVMYNSGLSPVNLKQDRFFYCNPLVWKPDTAPTHKHKTDQRWLVHPCYCCPPQMARTLASLQTWAYSIGAKSIWVNLYSGGTLTVRFSSGTAAIKQETSYPWNGRIQIRVTESPSTPFSLMLRIPGWSNDASLTLNGAPLSIALKPGTYAEVRRKWKTGDRLVLDLPMPVRLMESHPQVAANRNRVAVMRGPLVYCLELPLADGGRKTWETGVYFPENIAFTPRFDPQLLGGIVVLEGDALTQQGRDDFVKKAGANAAPAENRRSRRGLLYRTFEGRALQTPESGTVSVSLIPYFAWANRGTAYMQVWTSLAR